MEQKVSAYRGCILGMAVGDAMGYTVDKKTWPEICRDYGPNGLLGYDLVNGSAQITSYTQLAAFAANGLLMGVIRGDPDKYARYLAVSLKEWAKSQQFRTTAEKTFCWVAQVPELRRRQCMDTRILDALSRDTLGTPEKPVFRSVSPSTLTAAVAPALLYDPEKWKLSQVGALATQTVALTHGEPEAFLSGAVLTYALAGILHQPKKPLAQQFLNAADMADAQFEGRFPQVNGVTDLVRHALSLTRDPELTPLAAMTLLECTTAPQCLAGAAYASVIHSANFDEGMIAAVNHSGRSAAVGAITGALLGARLGVEALPEFYLESLEPMAVLEELATDLAMGRQALRIFDDSWDQKYVQGLPGG